MFVASLIATTPPGIKDSLRLDFASLLPSHSSERVLVPGMAIEWHLPQSTDPNALRELLREKFATEAVDINIIAAAGRRKKVFLADMDSTIVDGETLDELAAFAGIGEEVAAITARAMNGEIDFKQALHQRVALIKGLPESAIDEVLASMRYIDGGRPLLAALKAHHIFTVLVSGGFLPFTSRVRKELGFDADYGNILHINNGTLMGTVEDPILDRHAKKAILEDVCTLNGCTPAEAIAIGDGTNDLLMLQTAGIGIAFRPKPALAAAVSTWVHHSDLRAAWYLMGFEGGV